MNTAFSSPALSKTLIAVAILGAHLCVLGLILDPSTDQRSARTGQPKEFVATAQIIVLSPTWDKVRLPEVELDSVPTDLNALKMIQFDDPDQDQLTGIVGPASAPLLRRFQSANVQEFAQRAGILPDHPVTVVLSVRVDAGGAADSVDVVRGSGIAAADAAAVDYALSLRWVPGTVDHNPRSMRIILPVILVRGTN